MKIKFIKEYRALQQFDACDVYEVGVIDNATEDEAQWLIDNGFAERCEEQWPLNGDLYWFVDEIGSVVFDVGWINPTDEFTQREIGNVFKTRESAQRFADYLKAVETVRHDDGFMKHDKTYGKVWVLRKACLAEGVFAACGVAVGFRNPGAFYFDTEKHAKASGEKHPNEWQTILNYDWSKGEE